MPSVVKPKCVRLAVFVLAVLLVGSSPPLAADARYPSAEEREFDLVAKSWDHAAALLMDASCWADCGGDCVLGVCVHDVDEGGGGQVEEKGEEGETIEELLAMKSSFDARSSDEEYNCTVVLNPWHRPHLLRDQLLAIGHQTFAASEIWIVITDSPHQGELEREVASTCGELGLPCSLITSNKNFVYYLQFQVAMQATTRYVWFMDDDVIPRRLALEYLLHVSNTEKYQDAMLGGRATCEWSFTGVDATRMLSEGQTYRDPCRYCWGPQLAKISESENLDGGKFLRREHLKLMFREEPGSASVGDPYKWFAPDVQLSYVVRKYAGARSFVLPCEYYPDLCLDADKSMGVNGTTRGDRVTHRGRTMIRLFQRGSRQVWWWKVRRTRHKRLVLLFAHTFKDGVIMANIRDALHQSADAEPHVVVTGAEEYGQEAMRSLFGVSDEDYEQGVLGFSCLQLGKDMASSGRHRNPAAVAAEVLDHMGELLEALKPAVLVLPRPLKGATDPVWAAAALAAKLGSVAMAHVSVTLEGEPLEVPGWLEGSAGVLPDRGDTQGDCGSPLLHEHRRLPQTGHALLSSDSKAYVVSPLHGSFLACNHLLNVTFRAALHTTAVQADSPSVVEMLVGGKVVATQPLPARQLGSHRAEINSTLLLETVVPVTRLAALGDAPSIVAVEVVQRIGGARMGAGELLAVSEHVIETHEWQREHVCSVRAPRLVPPRVVPGGALGFAGPVPRRWLGDVVSLEGGEGGYGAVERSVFSQNGEDGVLLAILEELKLEEAEQHYVEIGAHDGSQCNSRVLREGLDGWGWRGFMFDDSKEDLEIGLHRQIVTAENVEQVFDEFGVPRSFGLLSIGIDGLDLQVWASVVNWRPAVVIIEYNSVVPPDVDWVMPAHVPADDGEMFSDQSPTTLFTGAGFLPMLRLGALKGYVMVHAGLRGANLFFVRQDLAGSLKSAGGIWGAAWVGNLGVTHARFAHDSRVGWVPCLGGDPGEVFGYPWSSLAVEVPGVDHHEDWGAWAFERQGEGGQWMRLWE